MKEINMKAYYFEFEPTKVLVIDKVLSAVADAGQSYHHTSQWADSNDGDISAAEEIQLAANEAAKVYKKIDELEFNLADSEAKWIGFADLNFKLNKQISELKSLLTEAGMELIHSNRYAQSNEKEQLIAKIVEGYKPKITIF